MEIDGFFYFCSGFGLGKLASCCSRHSSSPRLIQLRIKAANAMIKQKKITSRVKYSHRKGGDESFPIPNAAAMYDPMRLSQSN